MADKTKLDDWDDDPELGDERDPEYAEEIFQTMKYMGWKPEDLPDPKDQSEYATWLINQMTKGERHRGAIDCTTGRKAFSKERG